MWERLRVLQRETSRRAGCGKSARPDLWGVAVHPEGWVGRPYPDSWAPPAAGWRGGAASRIRMGWRVVAGVDRAGRWG